MVKNKLTKTEDIHVKVDQNNLIYIDPNSTIDDEGNISARNIQQEKLVMYVNLEADLISRSTLSTNDDTNTHTSLASGTLNFLKNADGKDYDTTWTNSFLNTEEKKDSNGKPSGEFFQSDKTGQSFGINDINISIKGFNAIPTININFIDVRGKTLFESSENSPYKAFFHIPWPIFYLTVKGFYGKAIKYRLHLVKFTSKFNESNGNFEVNTSFVGSTYAYLSDIPLQGILNAPYLFPNESNKTETSNTKTKNEVQTLTKSSRGYDMLKTVYNEYKLKGLIPNDFPVKTLREVLIIAENLDSLLEKQIFGQIVDMRLFAAMKEFGENIDEFEKSIRAWSNVNLDNTPVISKNEVNLIDPTSPYQSFYFKPKVGDKKSTKIILGEGDTGTLEHLIKKYKTLIDKSQFFTTTLINSQQTMINNTSSSFTKSSLGVSKIEEVINYYDINTDDNSFVFVKIEKLVDNIREVRKNFEQQRDKLEKDVELKMNEIVRNKKNGFGFEPTIRNIFAVILSNAEVLIRLMKDVHKKAFEQADTRKKIVSDFSKESLGESIYPWPEIKATVKNKENTLIYPGDPDFITKLGSDNPVRWPEVAFLESYIGVATNKVDPLADKESGNEKIEHQIQNDVDLKSNKKVSPSNGIVNILPFVNKLPDSFIYEIYERAFTYTLVDSFSTNTIQELANIEFENIFESIKGERTLRKILKENVKNITLFRTQLEKLSPFERFSYYKDSLPTTDYLKSFYSQPFSIEQYKISNSYNDKGSYTELTLELQNQNPEEYRTNIYPFSSDVYLTYLNGVSKFDNSLLKLNNFLEVNTTQGLISGQVDPKFWTKNGGITVNLFSQKFNVLSTSTNILNTPYFHKQLYSDFFNITSSYGKYAGSAYLLLNSMSFTELDEIKTGNSVTELKPYNVLVSSLFREIGSTQYIPYHLILKWGSIYHRYKKYLIENIDILGPNTTTGQLGFLTSGMTPNTITGTTTGFTTTKINGNVFFDNNSGVTYNTINYSGNTDVGIHPYYDNIFYNIVNDIDFYDTTTTEYTESINEGTLKLKSDSVANTNKTLNYWTQYIDDSYKLKLKTFTLLPSSGGNGLIGKKSSNSFTVEEQNNFRIIWDDDSLNDSFTDQTFSSPIDYSKTITGDYGIGTNYKKVMDLIATFNPSILDEFETYFLNFASEKINFNVSNKPFETVVYSNFQDLLKEMVTIDKDNSTQTDLTVQINYLKTEQAKKLKTITTKILSSDNLIKITIGNPKEFDPHVLIGFIGEDKNNTFLTNPYNSITFDIDLMNLYLGIEPEDNCYKSFFIDNNIEFNEENLQIFRPLVYMYAGYKKVGSTLNFKDYVNENILTGPKAFNYRLDTFMEKLIPLFSQFGIEEDQSRIEFFDGYNNKPLKVELYNFFKSMNDKWIAGNSIGQKSLLEEFLFLDKANKDIGDEYYFDISRLKNLGDPKNSKISLFSAISTLLSETGFDLRALPAYINFYGTNFSNTPKVTPSKKIAKNLFGTFLDVDTQESSPKIVIQYVGKNSIRPDMGENNKTNKYKFTDDSFNIGNVNNNPVMITLPKVFKTGDLAKTNKVVAFEVSFGDQNQSIFKGVTLDQASIKNTSESFYVLENLARSESGSSSHNVDIGLYDYYRQAAYTCDVTCMGNAMIQPTMYFYLKNIPMFKGTYWITEVTHSIKNGSMTTSFKGSRMPYTSLPDLRDSFMSSYKTLFDKIQKKAINRIKGSDKVTETSRTVTTKDGSIYTYDTTTESINGEKFVEDADITNAGIPFNGYKGSRYITQVINNGTWLRAQAVTMGGDKYQITNSVGMSIISQSKTVINPSLTWDTVKEFNNKYQFYATKFLTDKVKVEDMIKLKTTFINPNISNSKPITINTDFKVNVDVTSPIQFSGPIDIIRDVEPYGIALSEKLMTDLRLADGQIVYFKVE